MVLIEILKKYKYTNPIVLFLRKIKHYYLAVIIFHIKKILRVYHIIKNSPYEKLKMLKNKHFGERCFIVATGPSLTIQDLEKLKNEITFSMNSICLAFDETDWRPTYYGIQDFKVYKKLKEHIDQLNVEGCFIGDNIAKKIKMPKNSYIFPINFLNHLVPHKHYTSKFSDDAFAVVYSGYSITYSLLQIAVYMGFKEIYLLGVDCNYSSDMKHHFKEYGHVDPEYYKAHAQMTAAFKEAKKFADKKNIKIYNATRGGKLEVFERVDLDEVFIISKLPQSVSK